MSDETPANPTITERPANDFAQKDLEVIQAYEIAGLPGIAVVDDKKMASMIEMYLSGKTYRQISTTMSIKKDIVLYMSYKFNWFGLRNDYITDLETSMRGRALENKIADQEFLLSLAAMYRKKIGSNANKYFATSNEEFANAVDSKDVDKYLKVVDSIQKLTSEGKSLTADNNRPMIGVNAGDGVTITRKGNNEIEITPKSKAIGDALKQFADSRREAEKNKR